MLPYQIVDISKLFWYIDISIFGISIFFKKIYINTDTENFGMMFWYIVKFDIYDIFWVW